MGAGHELHVGRALAAARSNQRDALVRDDQGYRRAMQVIDGLLENPFEIVRTVRRDGMVGGAIG